MTIPHDAVMYYNVVKLKDGVMADEFERILEEFLVMAKETYGDAAGGFIGGQVFEFAGFVSTQESLPFGSTANYAHYAIATYWMTFEHYEKSRKNQDFLEKIISIFENCSETHELSYKMLYQK